MTLKNGVYLITDDTIPELDRWTITVDDTNNTTILKKLTEAAIENNVEFSIKRITCNDCQKNKTCEFAYDWYNIDHNCLAGQ